MDPARRARPVERACSGLGWSATAGGGPGASRRWKMRVVPSPDEPGRDQEDDAKGGPEAEPDIGEVQHRPHCLRPWKENDAWGWIGVSLRVRPRCAETKDPSSPSKRSRLSRHGRAMRRRLPPQAPIPAAPADASTQEGTRPSCTLPGYTPRRQAIGPPDAAGGSYETCAGYGTRPKSTCQCIPPAGAPMSMAPSRSARPFRAQSGRAWRISWQWLRQAPINDSTQRATVAVPPRK
jgi:hypothetical protein